MSQRVQTTRSSSLFEPAFTCSFISKAISLIACVICVQALAAEGPSWSTIQEIKIEALSVAARHAMEQQKREQASPINLDLRPVSQTNGELEIASSSERALEIHLSAASISGSRAVRESFRIELKEPMDMLTAHSGLSMLIETQNNLSPEVRWGVRLIGANGQVAEITPVIPLLDHWGSHKHEIYFDWAFINYAKVDEAIAVLESVKALEFTAAAKARAPRFGPSDSPQKAEFTLSNLRLVDYLHGSYDPNRHSWGWDGSKTKDLTLQHRVLEVSGVVARFGGEAGIQSAIDALDMAARTQCWDGSFLDRRRGPRTVASGEYTHGFTLWGLLDAYEFFKEIEHPALEEVVSAGPENMTRDEWYQRMIYRCAMSRASALASEYRDDIIRSDTLVFGANRVLGYAVAMRRAAEAVTDPSLRAEILSRYTPIMEEIAAAQGAHSGGFPILGEGDRYDGKGIHYDAGYTRTHIDWLVIGVESTGDPLLVKMLDHYQDAIVAIMSQGGDGILPLLSERGRETHPVRLVIPDVTAQIGIEYNLPVIAQWGYNVGMPTWAKWEPGARLNHYTNRMHARGYSLAVHTNLLLSDLRSAPIPFDIGYRFPRQFPLWSSRFYRKDSREHVRTSRTYVDSDGGMQNDFRIEVGEFPETVGVPLWLVPSKGTMAAEVIELTGWPTLLKQSDLLHFQVGERSYHTSPNRSLEVMLADSNPIEVTITGPSVTLPAVAGGKTIPFEARVILTPSKPGTKISLTFRNDCPEYSHSKWDGNLNAD